MAGPRSPSETVVPKRRGWIAPLVVLLLTVGTVVFVLRAPTDLPERPPAASAAPAVGGVDGSVPVAPPRCRPARGRSAFRIGEDSGPVRGAGGAPPAKVAEPATTAEEPEPWFEPFAVLLGRGVHHAKGYAVGVKRDTPEGSVAEIALVDGATGSGRLVRLGQSRGDVEAPQVVSTGEALVAAMLEPNASGFSLQLARLVGDKLHWGAELPQERDESLAFDLAVGDEALVVAWDAARDDGEGTEILLATLDPAELAITVEPRSVSPAGTDAELPRLVPRPGGFWLVYVARKTSALPPHPSDEELGKDPKQERYAAEMIEQSWVEIQPLGPTGKPDGGARRATSPLGHVQGYDVRAAAGALHLAWRDDDTPTGAQGGRVSLLVAQLAGLDEPTIVADEDVGLGGPSLLAGWLGIADAGGRMRLAPLGSDGGVLGEMRAEPVLGLGQLLAAGNQSLLLARPAGPAVELVLVECDRPAGKP